VQSLVVPKELNAALTWATYVMENCIVQHKEKKTRREHVKKQEAQRGLSPYQVAS